METNGGTAAAPDGTVPQKPGGRGVLAFLRAHPVVTLLLLTPGVPEYISGSSPMNALVLDPPMFLFQLAADLALYGPGVLLVREAMVRWKKGWGSVLLLGAAYAILEEGIAVGTLFDPHAHPVGQLGFYGHWLGVSWIWVAQILPVHMIFSISLPILLLGFAAPETRGASFLSRRGIATVSAILGFDVALLFVAVYRAGGYWMGWPVFVGSLVAMAVLVAAARRLPGDALHAARAGPVRGPRTLGLIGALYYTSALLAGGLGMGAGFPAWVDLSLVVAVEGIFLAVVLRVAGSTANERQLIALALGLVVPISAIGFVSEVRLPLSLLPLLAYVLFLRRLWSEYPEPALAA